MENIVLEVTRRLGLIGTSVVGMGLIGLGVIVIARPAVLGWIIGAGFVLTGVALVSALLLASGLRSGDGRS